MSVTINEGTQTDILTTTVGGTETGIIRLDVGVGTTRSDFGGTITTVDKLTNGSINILTGTLNSLPQVSVGTIPQVSVGTLPTLNVTTGTINVLPQISVGTLPTLNLTTGTITTGSLANIGQVHNAGTLAAGTNNIGDVDIVTIPQVSVGTLPTLNITTGTVTLVPTVTTVSNLTNGSINVLTGTTTLVSTVTTVSNLTNGSVNILTGTVTSVANLAGGTVRIDPTSVVTPLTWGTLGTAGGSLFGTLSAASGAGTKHYISGLQVVGQSGTVDVRILVGTAIQGAGVLAGGICVPAGGFARDFEHDYQTGTNSELTYHFVGAGTAFITVNYWKGA